MALSLSLALFSSDFPSQAIFSTSPRVAPRRSLAVRIVDISSLHRSSRLSLTGGVIHSKSSPVPPRFLVGRWVPSVTSWIRPGALCTSEVMRSRNLGSTASTNRCTRLHALPLPMPVSPTISVKRLQ